jgi:hypothetical protein
MPGKIVITGKAKEHADRLKVAMVMRDRKEKGLRGRLLLNFVWLFLPKKCPNSPEEKAFKKFTRVLYAHRVWGHG